MKQYTTYNPTTGQITGYYSTSESDDNVDVNYSDRIEGHYDAAEYRIVNGQPEQQLIEPTVDWAQLSRDHRDNLLLAVDRVNPVRYSTLTTEQQAELVAYRQQLLDVPQQAGFPAEVTWPVKPEWL